MSETSHPQAGRWIGQASAAVFLLMGAGMLTFALFAEALSPAEAGTEKARVLAAVRGHLLVASVPLLGLAAVAWVARRRMPVVLDWSRVPDELFARRRGWNLFLVSAIGLFLEILIIRWISVEVRIFSYFRNLALLACFFGLGLGVLRAASRVYLWAFLGPLLVLIGLTYPIRGTRLSPLGGLAHMVASPALQLWDVPAAAGAARIALGLAGIACVIGLLVLMFVPWGQLLGRLLEAGQPLEAYSINIAGSLVGIWMLNVLAWLRTPPIVWFAAGLAAVAWLVRGRRPALALTAGCGALVLAGLLDVGQHGKEVFWSPYQKLGVAPMQETRRAAAADAAEAGGWLLEINNTYYMSLVDLSATNVARHADTYDVSRLPYYHYNLPYRFKPQPANVLIVGAGAGNDAAAALRAGAGHVVAVEIDPVIVALGRQRHPERPYDDPRVEVVTTDARAYFKSAGTRRFDVIVFGLLDSHTLTSNFSNIRLDHYVYTRESFAEARKLLAPDGVMVVTFESQRDWITARIFTMLASVFAQAPVVFRDEVPFAAGAGGIVFAAGDGRVVETALARDAALRDYVAGHKVEIPSDGMVATDDWPYLYLRAREVPPLIVQISAALLVLFGVISWAAMPSLRSIDSHFLFLGSAFLLLEFKAISKLSLVFGSTWVVSAAVITAILVMILAANLLVRVWRITDRRGWYVALAVSVLAGYVLPAPALLSWPPVLAKVVATAIECLPLLFAGVIFAVSFRSTKDVQVAFGCNLLGAVIGGLTESLSFVTGISALSLVVLAYYALSAVPLFRPRRG